MILAKLKEGECFRLILRSERIFWWFGVSGMCSLGSYYMTGLSLVRLLNIFSSALLNLFSPKISSPSEKTFVSRSIPVMGATLLCLWLFSVPLCSERYASAIECFSCWLAILYGLIKVYFLRWSSMILLTLVTFFEGKVLPNTHPRPGFIPDSIGYAERVKS